MDQELNVLDRRAGRIKSGQDQLEQVLNGVVIDDVEFIFKATQEHRGVLVMRGPGLSANITDVDPHHLGPILECKAHDPDSQKTADLLNQYVKRSFELLNDHPLNIDRKEQGKPPANIVLPRGAGLASKLEPLGERYGISFAGLAGVSLVRGVLRLTGATCIDVPGATGGADSDFNAKIKAGVDGLKDYDLMFINIKAPDLFGHDGDARGKVDCIEKIDSAFGYAKENLPEDAILVIAADHSTPTTVMDHSADPVPLCIYGPGCRVDRVEHYEETELATGGLGRIVGQNLMAIVQDLANRRHKFGA